MNGFRMIGERIVDGWQFDSLEQARDTFQKHLIAWFPDAFGPEPIYVCHGHRRGCGYLQVSGELQVTNVEFSDFVAVRRTSTPRVGCPSRETEVPSTPPAGLPVLNSRG